MHLSGIETELGQSYPPAIVRTLWLLALLSLVFSFYATTVGFHNSLLDFHGFRQAQTEMAVDSMLHGGSFLRYETPVLGPPWSIPFEFPLYQGIVAKLAQTFSTRIEETGHFVSILFYYLCFFPLASILSLIGLRCVRMVPALILFATSPVYVFVSHLFLIESTALFFSLLYADQMFRLVLDKKPWRFRHVAAGAVFGSLAGLVKATTFPPFLGIGVCLIAWGIWRDREDGKLKRAAVTIASVFSVVLPVAVVLSWTHFADGVKAQNPSGVYLISKALTAWNFGTLAQRLTLRPYLHFLNNVNNHLGNIGVAAVVLAVYIWLCRRWNRTAVACLLLYAAPTLVFFNLHWVHEYYPYANAIFLVVAAGVLITAMMELPGRRAWIGVALLMLEVAACGFRYFTHYYPIQSPNAQVRPAAAALVDSTTPPGSVIVILGLYWSPEFPYQCHRRAIMDVAPKDVQAEAWWVGPMERGISIEGPRNIAAFVACDAGRHWPRLPILLRDTEMPQETNLHADGCDIYERSAANGIPATP